MRAKFMLVASFVLALGMTGCSSSTDDEPIPAKGEDVLIVTLPSNAKYTRGVENPTDEYTQTGIEDVTVFLLTGQSVERAVEFTEDEMKAGYRRFEQVPSQVDRVIVVANRVGETITNLTNLNAIKTYGYTVASQHMGTELSNRTMMGEAVPSIVTESPGDGHLYKEANVVLEAITARIEVGTVVPGEGVVSVDLVAVYINNFYEKYRAADAMLYDENNSQWTVTEEYGLLPNIGSERPVGVLTLNSYSPAQYKNLADGRVVANDVTRVYAFHVFPGNVPHLVMLVKVELEDDFSEEKEDGTKLKYKYGYLTFNKYNTGKPEPDNYVTAMRGHNVYKMGVGKNGIPVNAKDITDKPEKGPYDLGVKVEIAEWQFHNVTPEV